jgi:hypothetical protein
LVLGGRFETVPNRERDTITLDIAAGEYLRANEDPANHVELLCIRMPKHFVGVA